MKDKVLEVIGVISASVLRMMPEIELGTAWDKKNKQKVYFSTLTKFKNTSYSDLKEGDEIDIFVVRTSRGLFAKNISVKAAVPFLNKAFHEGTRSSKNSPQK